MIKVLYVDIESPKGHHSLHKSHLGTLMSYDNINLECVFKKDYSHEHNIHIKKVIPKSLYSKKSLGGFFNRLLMLIRLIYFRATVNTKEYNYIIFASYEEISFFFSGINKKCFLINHNNASGLDSQVKLFFLRKISKRHTHVVFEDYIKNHFLDHGIQNVEVVKHGILPPYELNNNPTSILEKINPKLIFGVNDKIIFSASDSSSDHTFFNELITNNNFINFLKENHIILVIKSNFHKSTNENIIIINRYLSKVEYQTLFLKSFAIIIPYPSSFEYRISNVLNECISNNKLCFLSDIPALKNFSDNLIYKYYFSSIYGLKEKIEDAILNNINDNTPKYLNTENLKVDYKKLFI